MKMRKQKTKKTHNICVSSQFHIKAIWNVLYFEQEGEYILKSSCITEQSKLWNSVNKWHWRILLIRMLLDKRNKNVYLQSDLALPVPNYKFKMFTTKGW